MIFNYNKIKNIILIVPIIILNILLLIENRQIDSFEEVYKDKNNTIFFQNIKNGNQNYLAELKDQFKNGMPDIIFLVEAFEDYSRNLPDYIYFKQILERSNYGFSIYSKTPINILEVINFDNINTAIYLEAPELNLKIIAVHLPPPILNDLFEIQQKSLTRIKEIFIQNKKEKFVVLGDFNLTPWSREIRQFISGLIDIKHSNQGKWPSNLIVGFPLDHVFCTFNCKTNEHDLLNSDHIGYSVIL
jgi:endonuclease/exonuclease/phosphatase (EEP) superfamily protein YafD